MSVSQALIPHSTISVPEGVQRFPMLAPDEQAPSKKPVSEFKPVFSEHALYDPIEPNGIAGFNIASAKGYYAVMRTMHYLCEAVTPIGTSLIGFLLNRPGNGSCAESKAGAFKNFDAYLKIEAIGLSAIALSYLKDQYDHLKKDIAPALALEFGKPTEDIHFSDILSSKNPIVSIEAHRFMARTASRLAGCLPFAVGLPQGDGIDNRLRIAPGLFGVATNIWLERTAFYAKTPYDYLMDSISDVQSNMLHSEVTAEQTVAVFQRALQAMHQHRGREGLQIHEMQALHPLLLQAAHDVMDRKIGIDTMIAVIGGGIIIPDDIEQSVKNYEYIRTHGLEHAIDRSINRRSACPNSPNLWDHVNDPAEVEDLSNTPLSAQPARIHSARDRSWQREYFNSAFPGASFGI
ncbi:MAG: hypothetical protein EAZ74_01860 [Alphaproteobacteria bacterium]|nr:MAG: hypothetical protein EAZ74_01860 [Alphaproteobacteria bacterium]TAF40278.1 MAG: hypothetical protein EAZ66_03435 [Alphaproteobacteria bacterium]TAF77412.1 MAG: hypothetical protein EAZ52_00500 [Alphaproteobacteria bacterium]